MTSALPSIADMRGRRARVEVICPVEKILNFRIFYLPPHPNHFYIRCHPVPPRGALAIVFERWNGERWPLKAPLTKARDADGEVVWS